MNSFFAFVYSMFIFSTVSFARECPQQLGGNLSELRIVQAQKVNSASGELGPLQELNLGQMLGKVVILRLVGTWCPFCKGDMVELSKRYLATDKRSRVEVVVVAPSSSRETEASIRRFVAESAQSLGVAVAHMNFWFVPSQIDRNLNGFRVLVETTDSSGNPLFPNVTGVPYSMVYDKRGQLRLRGTFTRSAELTAAHYSAIDSMIEGCAN